MCCSDGGVWVKMVSGVTPPNDYNNVTTRSVAADDMAISPGWSFKCMHWTHASTSKTYIKKNIKKFFLYAHTTNTDNIGDKHFLFVCANSSETSLPDDDQSICQLCHEVLVIVEGLTCISLRAKIQWHNRPKKYHVVIEMCGLRKAEYGNKGSNMNEGGWQKLFCRSPFKPKKKKL